MVAITFDTLRFSNRLKAAGVPDKQAEAEAEALAEVFDKNLGELATRRDLKDLELATKRDIKELELRVVSELAPIKAELATLKWGMAIVVGGVVALILKSFFPMHG